MFIIDSQALASTIKKVEPDFVEVLPGIAHKVVKIIDEETPSKVIAGGLINEERKLYKHLIAVLLRYNKSLVMVS